MNPRVRLTREAEADLERLFDFVLERELARDVISHSLSARWPRSAQGSKH